MGKIKRKKEVLNVLNPKKGLLFLYITKNTTKMLQEY